MKISNSKKQLAEIIHENGGWRDGAEFTAQDGDGTGFIDFFKSKPRLDRDDRFWKGDYDCGDRIVHTSVTIKNWHQTILSRDEYFHLYPVAVASRPLAVGDRCEVAELGGVVGRITALDSEGSDFKYQVKLDSGLITWVHDACLSTSPDPVVESKPTIEQLAADYRNRKDYADRKQGEADAAKSDAEAKLSELVAAGKELGLVPVSAVKPAIDGCMHLVDMVPTRLQSHQEESVSAIGHVVNVELLYDKVRDVFDLLK